MTLPASVTITQTNTSPSVALVNGATDGPGVVSNPAGGFANPAVITSSLNLPANSNIVLFGPITLMTAMTVPAGSTLRIF